MIDTELLMKCYKAWNDAAMHANLCEFIVDDKMNRYLSNGEAHKPTQNDLMLAHQSLQNEYRLRVELDKLIAKYVLFPNSDDAALQELFR